MKQFLYWIKGSVITDDLLRECGLWRRLDGRMKRVPMRGPEGDGMMLWHESAGDLHGEKLYDPDAQEWVRERSWEQVIPDADSISRALYVGMFTDPARRPNRLSLQRKTQALLDRCEACVLGAGTEHEEGWLVPILRMHDGRPMMPRHCVFRDGEIHEQVSPEFAALDAMGERIVAQQRAESVEAFREAGGKPIDGKELFQIAAAALSVNYRVGMAELGLLKIPSDADLPSLLAALTGSSELVTLSAIVEAEKKIGKALTEAAILEALDARQRSVVRSNGGRVGDTDAAHAGRADDAGGDAERLEAVTDVRR